jgi:hypothetical protein
MRRGAVTYGMLTQTAKMSEMAISHPHAAEISANLSVAMLRMIKIADICTHRPLRINIICQTHRNASSRTTKQSWSLGSKVTCEGV